MSNNHNNNADNNSDNNNSDKNKNNSFYFLFTSVIDYNGFALYKKNKYSNTRVYLHKTSIKASSHGCRRTN